MNADTLTALVTDVDNVSLSEMDRHSKAKSTKSNKKKEPKLTQSERTELSDLRMFNATVELIVERGPAATSLKDVGELAGYSRGLAGNRFGSKDRLFSFVLRQLGDLWLQQLKSAVGQHTGALAIERALDQHYQFCLDAPDYVRTFYTLWFESINAGSELGDIIKGIHQRRFQDVVNWILNDPSIDDSLKLEADSIAAQFSASVIGIVYFWLANPNKLDETEQLHDGLKRSMAMLLRSSQN